MRGMCVHRRDDAFDFSIRHLGVKRQTDALVTRALAIRKMLEAETLSVSRFAVDGHDAAPRGDPVIEQRLHECVQHRRRSISKTD